MNKIQVIGGGTMFHVRPHFSLCAPAYGTIAKKIYEVIPDKDKALVLTKMAGGPFIETTEELSEYIDCCLDDDNVKVIIMSAAVCDFKVSGIEVEDEEYPSRGVGKRFDRLNSQKGYSLNLTGEDKIINKIKEKRPEILLVTFKTTSGEDAYDINIKCMNQFKNSQSDVVIGNDLKTRENFMLWDGEYSHVSRGNLPHTLLHILRYEGYIYD